MFWLDNMAQDQTFKKNYSYEIDCMRHFLKLRYHENSPVHYSITDSLIKVFYYYDDIDLFDVDKDISILKQFLKRCKLHQKGWDVDPKTVVTHPTTNYSNIFFTKTFNYMTRLDILRL